MTRQRQKQEGKRRIPRGFVFPGAPSDFDAFLKLPKHRPGLIRGVWVQGKFKTVAEMIANGKRKFEAAQKAAGKEK